MEAPKDLERQICLDKWEDAEQYLREHPEVTEVIVEYVPNQHVYKVARTSTGELVRLHYDRVCVSCQRFFLHGSKLFTCQDCLNKK